jgi:hypothetical protein
MRFIALRKFLLSVLILAFPVIGFAQGLLSKSISIQVTRKPVSEALKEIGKKGGFYFSYNSNIIHKDSLVSFTAINKPVKQILDELFEGTYEYTEKKNYIILQQAEGNWFVSGYIMDAITQDRVSYASVYEKNQLVSTLTNEQGYFRLKLKNKVPANITVSKAWFADTSFTIKPENNNKELALKIIPENFLLDSIVVTQYSALEKTWLSKLLISSRQRMQSINLNKFFVDKPYQASIIPGVGTHGSMTSQVVNKVSFNLFGGYSAGVNGVEIGGLVNIVKNDAQYTQIAGLFNTVGGDVTGVQIAGVFNNVLDSFIGVQVGGVGNHVKEIFSGVQVGGVYNHVSDTFKGTQVAGVANFSKKSLSGTQVSGVANVTTQTITGAQVSGVLNIAKNVEGVQVGLINLADSSSGYTVGLINLVKNGYHKAVISANDIVQLNVFIKTGTIRLYSILFAGKNFIGKDAFTFGYGLGRSIPLGKRFTINPEITTQHLYLGDWDNLNLLMKVTANLNVNLGKYVSVFAGPYVAGYYTTSNVSNEGYLSQIPPAGYNSWKVSNDLNSWIGWNVGINFF